MKLSKRMNAIKQLVPQGGILADIGCDHAYLPCACVLDQTCIKAYACDVNEGPLQHAMETIQECGVETQVFPILCSGLSQCPEDVDTIIISGMGYETIKSILEADFHRLSRFKRLILQSNSDVELLRDWLSEHYFKIIDEVMVHEGHYYQILAVSPTGGRKLSDDEKLFGPIMPNKPLFHDYWTFKLEKLNVILSQLGEQHEKYTEFSELAERIRKQLKTSSE